MKKKRIPCHYRCYDGSIPCGTTSTRIDATSVVKGTTCKRCMATYEMRILLGTREVSHD